jgi:hypothetical protein
VSPEETVEVAANDRYARDTIQGDVEESTADELHRIVDGQDDSSEAETGPDPSSLPLAGVAAGRKAPPRSIEPGRATYLAGKEGGMPDE